MRGLIRTCRSNVSIWAPSRGSRTDQGHLHFRGGLVLLSLACEQAPPSATLYRLPAETHVCCCRKAVARQPLDMRLSWSLLATLCSHFSIQLCPVQNKSRSRAPLARMAQVSRAAVGLGDTGD